MERKNLKELPPQEVAKITEHNFEIFKSQLNGNEIKEDRIDFCWFCNSTFTESEAEYCEKCLTYKCPVCKGCYCNLPPIAQQALDNEMMSLGLWNPFHNPKRRKKKKHKGAEYEVLKDGKVIAIAKSLSEAKEIIEFYKKESPEAKFDFRPKLEEKEELQKEKLKEVV
jgi:hypothetical protein